MLRRAPWLLALAAGCGTGASPTAPPVAPAPARGGLPLEESDAAHAGALDARRLGPVPAISGGTLTITRDGRAAVAADPDRDQIYVVGLAGPSLRGTVELPIGDEPGRVAEDGAGRAHVVLRGGGAVATVDIASGELVARRAVCPAPRGIAWDAAGDRVWVACAGGELRAFAADGFAPLADHFLERDLRDVVVGNGVLWVTTFRDAKVLVIDPATGTIGARLSPPPFQAEYVERDAKFSPRVAWRTLPFAGGLAMLHQRAQSDLVAVTYAGDDSQCGSIVHGAVTVIRPPSLPPATGAIATAILPVDLAASRDGKQLALVSAGIDPDDGRPQVLYGAAAAFEADGACQSLAAATLDAPGQPIAIAFDGAGRPWVQTREPALLQVARRAPGDHLPPPLVLSTVPRADEGHHLFHHQSGHLIACAGCHPEGGEDGHTWRLDAFVDGGPRRTMSLRGGVLARAPFHWTGDLASFPDLVSEVLVNRMGGQLPSPAQIDALGRWLDGLPLPARSPAKDPLAVARGAELFAGDGGCIHCHGGPQLTDHAESDVGTGRDYKVPSLVGVGLRAPYLHDGCAATLRDRFTDACRGAGHDPPLSDLEMDDLASYLDTL